MTHCETILISIFSKKEKLQKTFILVLEYENRRSWRWGYACLKSFTYACLLSKVIFQKYFLSFMTKIGWKWQISFFFKDWRSKQTKFYEYCQSRFYARKLLLLLYHLNRGRKEVLKVTAEAAKAFWISCLSPSIIISDLNKFKIFSMR